MMEEGDLDAEIRGVLGRGSTPPDNAPGSHHPFFFFVITLQPRVEGYTSL